MLHWSNFMFPLMVGGLAAFAALLDYCQGTLPAWGAAVVAMTPLLLFTFVCPGEWPVRREMPVRLVRLIHVVASIWYLVVTMGLFAVLAVIPAPRRGWQIYPLFLSIGAAPYVVVLYRAAIGQYQPPAEPEMLDDLPRNAADTADI